MQEIKSGSLMYPTRRAYDEFRQVQYELGGGTIKTVTNGIVTENNGLLTLKGTVQYTYSDEFTDIANIRQKLTRGNSSIGKVHLGLKGNLEMIITDLAGSFYLISQSWNTKIEGSIPVNSKN